MTHDRIAIASPADIKFINKVLESKRAERIDLYNPAARL
jgi:hypothetical protein